MIFDVSVGKFMRFFFKVASDEWYEKPIVIRIDAVSRELTNKENFPTVVLCPKQTKGYIDEFGLVKVALEMIEFNCNKSLESMPDKCDSYNSVSQKILEKVCTVETCKSFVGHFTSKFSTLSFIPVLFNPISRLSLKNLW